MMNTNERTMEVKTFALIKRIKETSEYKNCDITVEFELTNGVQGYDEKGRFTYTFLEKKPSNFFITPKYLKQIQVLGKCSTYRELYEKRADIIRRINDFANDVYHAKRAYGYITVTGQRMVGISRNDGTELFYILDSKGCPTKANELDADKFCRKLTVRYDQAFSKKAWNITDWFYGI